MFISAGQKRVKFNFFHKLFSHLQVQIFTLPLHKIPLKRKFPQLKMESDSSKGLNILILGETGVGKSTWINSFMNFVTYKTLEEAQTKDLLSLIPSEFSVCNENLERVTVKTGEDKNEDNKKGQSATQDSRVYTFNVKGTTVRLIDTPGVGDTRGVDQDKTNFENILSTIQGFSVIHGICILLKPNESRITLMFRFCIKELLTHLHKDAIHNIVFCFTNTRGTFYRPGDTLVSLKEVLDENKMDIIKKDRVYCFDSEAYRFLAAIKNDPPVKFPKEEKMNFSKSWEKSILETNRLLNHIRSLSPHQVKSTLSLNNARNIVIKLTKPLADITGAIETNKEMLERNKKEIHECGENIDELKSKLTYRAVVIEQIHQNYPDTVCSHINCMELVNDIHGRKIVQNKQKCHDHCYLGGIHADTIGHAKLLRCATMYNGVCKKCHHSYQFHSHRYSHTVQKIVFLENSDIRKSLNSNMSSKELKEKLLADRDKNLQELQFECEIIRDASVKFACFLKFNAITAFNDEMEKYLNHLIDAETLKVQQGDDKTVLEGLKGHLQSYIEQKKSLEAAISLGDRTTEISMQEIEKTVELLKNLKRNGGKLKDALDYVNATAENVYKLSLHPMPTTTTTTTTVTTKTTTTRERVWQGVTNFTNLNFLSKSNK